MAPRAARLTSDEPEEGGGEPLDLSHLHGIVGYPLRRAQLVVFDDFARRFRALDLTPAQYSTLVTIGDNPGRKQSEIAAALGIQRPNFVAMMDELERRGLAERIRSGADRRSNALALTLAGEALLSHARAVQSEQEASIDALLGRHAREALVRALHRLAELVDDKPIAGVDRLKREEIR
jgi:DNA-binding MarR family transcriptional regulator